MSTDLRAIGFLEIRGMIRGKRLAVLDALTRRGPSTSSELARFMGWTVLSVRPRLTELASMYHAATTGKRRDSEHVYRYVPIGEAMLWHEADRNRYAIELKAQDQQRASVKEQVAAQLEIFA